MIHWRIVVLLAAWSSALALLAWWLAERREQARQAEYWRNLLRVNRRAAARKVLYARTK